MMGKILRIPSASSPIRAYVLQFLLFRSVGEYPVNVKLCIYSETGKGLSCKKLYHAPSTNNPKTNQNEKNSLLGSKLLKHFY